MSEQVCPIAYDHTDDLDECFVCGWQNVPPKPVLSEYQLRQEARYKRHPWLRPEGQFAPSRPVVLCDRRVGGADD